MTTPEIDLMNNTPLFSIFMLGVFTGTTLSMLVAVYNENRRKKYEDER